MENDHAEPAKVRGARYMNRRAFLLGSTAAVALPAPAPPRTMTPVLNALPCDLAAGAVNSVVSDALSDLMVFGRCVMFVDREGWRVLDPFKPGPPSLLSSKPQRPI
jgi:hypothetical protein